MTQYSENTLKSLYKNCTICPRNCNVDRTKGEKGFCKESSNLRLAFAGLHKGEEPLLTTGRGSGVVFITGCNLQCKFCQNYQISQEGLGKIVSEDALASLCISLQEAGASNINLVTGTHQAPLLVLSLQKARNMGLKIPVCYNTSGYESIETLEFLSSVVDIWLPDLKTLDSKLAKTLFLAKDYPQIATRAISWILCHTKLNITNDNPQKITSGTIVRHLFLPGNFFDTANVLEWLKHNADSNACVSLMTQYTPTPQAKDIQEFSANRIANLKENEDLSDLVNAYDFNYLFYQELPKDCTKEIALLPNFQARNVFPESLCTTLWHYKD